MCCIQAEFEIINQFLKERRSKYTQVNAPSLKNSVAVATVAQGGGRDNPLYRGSVASTFLGYIWKSTWSWTKVCASYLVSFILCYNAIQTFF